MISSYQSFTFYARDMSQSLQRKASDPIIARDAKYYRDTIGSIKTIDEFLNNDRIYTYAMKAYGLEEMTYAKAFIRKILESDLADSNSFANRLEDNRYKALAAAYDFGKTVATKVVQTSSQIENLIGTYDQTIASNDTFLQQETDYFVALTKTFTNVDDLFANTRTRDYVFKAFNIDPKTFDYQTIRNVITSDISDPASYVNTEFFPKLLEWDTILLDLYDQRIEPGKTPAEKEKIDYLITQYSKRIDTVNTYFELAASFNFKADGSLDPAVSVQSDAQQKLVTERYVFTQPRLTQTGALLNKSYYEEKIASVTSITELLNDGRLSKMVLQAFGISLNTSKADVEWALKQDPSDPASPIHAKGKAFVALASAFNFEADGSLTPSKTAQDETQKYDLLSNYIVRYDDADEEADAEATTKYKRYIGLTANLDDFLSRTAAAGLVREYALKAHNISPDEVSLFKLKQILTSDPYDPKSYLNSLKDERFVKLAKSFNFAADGSIGSPRFAQSENEITRIAKAYYAEMTRNDSSQSAKDKAEAEISYYRSKMQTLETVDELVADERISSLLLTAEGFKSKEVNSETLRKILISDLADPTSYANTLNDIRFQKITGSFNFTKEGFIDSSVETGVQTQRGIIETSNLFLTQMLEQEAGEDNVGARLALYFQRMAPTLRSVYEILADTALADFVRTSLSIPAETAGADIDVQKKLLERYLDINDLQDPEKVDIMVRRFLALYDIENGTPDPLTSLFSGNNSISFETVAALSQLRNS
ncbi:DUF1217 domain-containing protein [Hoeflea sp. YIM 152468]|uniref:DUF1217 domain-containing protein n=1 Tax=Hoeflea sp. YIM 152468 TaxID=3031759 RepID=UPI0023DCD18C|nr:DUF1217 domain-containing protein [Hoeflea sp. YIM 152468]MDF1609506.1 DUF1217 domain-containing protein [Hoeflea sp. YIM 152468]